MRAAGVEGPPWGRAETWQRSGAGGADAEPRERGAGSGAATCPAGLPTSLPARTELETGRGAQPERREARATEGLGSAWGREGPGLTLGWARSGSSRGGPPGRGPPGRGPPGRVEFHPGEGHRTYMGSNKLP